MKVRVLYEVTVDGVHYTPGEIEVKPGVGLLLVQEHRGNFDVVEEREPEPEPEKKPERLHKKE